jgi:hypothetical protein
MLSRDTSEDPASYVVKVTIDGVDTERSTVAAFLRTAPKEGKFGPPPPPLGKSPWRPPKKDPCHKAPLPGRPRVKTVVMGASTSLRQPGYDGLALERFAKGASYIKFGAYCILERFLRLCAAAPPAVLDTQYASATSRKEQQLVCEQQARRALSCAHAGGWTGPKAPKPNATPPKKAKAKVVLPVKAGNVPALRVLLPAASRPPLMV